MRADRGDAAEVRALAEEMPACNWSIDVLIAVHPRVEISRTKIYLHSDVETLAATQTESERRRTQMLNNLSGFQGALIGLALVVFFIVRQFSTRRATSTWMFLVPLALAYFGLQGLGQISSTGWLLLGVNLSLGVGLGLARGMTFRVWAGEQGEALMRGTALTLVLWVATIAVRIVLSIAEVRFGLVAMPPSTAEMLLPAAATIAAQVLAVYLRGHDLQLAAA
ncbi:MAG TPA: hypothetical protein VFB50_08675 [Chloroflexota bacterium]|nr:hypothetical protein [Chloroflexota bacterium]